MPKNTEKKELQNKAISSVVWKLSERVCAQVVSSVVSIILARILVPDDYSIVSVIAIFFQFSNIIISGGLSTALIQKKDADELDYSSVLTVTLGMSVFVYLILFTFSGFIANIYNKPPLIPAIRVMGITLIINAFKSVICARISSNLEFRKFFASTIIGTVISAVVGIVMAKQGFGFWALIAQQMTNSTIDTIILSITTRFKPSFRVSMERLKSLFSYGSKIYFASMISVAYEQVKPLIVGLKFSATDLAYYNRGENFPQLLNSSISDTVSSVLFPVIARVQDEIDEVKQMTRRYMRTTSYIVFPLMMGFLAVAESFVTFFLTDKWLPIVPYIRIFCFCYMFDVIITGNLQAIRAIGRSDVILKIEVIKKVSYLVVILIFVLFADSPIMIAAASIVTTILACVINAYPNRKLIQYSYREQIGDIAGNLILSGIMVLAVWPIKYLPLSSFVCMMLQIITGITVYVLISVLIKNENLRYILNVVKDRIHKKGKEDS